jgi:tol-pal system protein YbgF
MLENRAMLQTFARHGLAGMVASLLAMPVMAEPLSDDAANQLLQRISDMEREVSTLRGDNEKLRNEIENLQKDQKDRFTQVDEKMDKLKDTAKSSDSHAATASVSASTSSHTEAAKTDEKKADSSTSDSYKSDTKPVEKTDPNSYYSYGTGKNDDANPPKSNTDNASDKPTDARRDSSNTNSSSITSSSTGGSSASHTATNTSGSQDERTAYDVAFDTLLKSPKEAIPMFRKFLKDYPSSSRASVAQYYIGAAYYTEKDYKAATDEFLTVLREYKGSEKGSDAALKLGYSFYELQDWEKARKTLEDVIKFFPNTDAARDASTRLDRMKSEGH